MDLRRIILISFVMILLSCWGGSAAAAGLKFSLSFDKEEYSKKDNINVTFKLKNTGRVTIYVNKRFFMGSGDKADTTSEVYLEVISPQGEKLISKISQEAGLPRTDYFMLLKPQEEARSERPKNIKYYFAFDEEGEYKIKGIYHNIYGDEIGVDAFKGRLVSDEVRIKIVK